MFIQYYGGPSSQHSFENFSDLDAENQLAPDNSTPVSSQQTGPGPNIDISPIVSLNYNL